MQMIECLPVSADTHGTDTGCLIIQQRDIVDASSRRAAFVRDCGCSYGRGVAWRVVWRSIWLYCPREGRLPNLRYIPGAATVPGSPAPRRGWVRLGRARSSSTSFIEGRSRRPTSAQLRCGGAAGAYIFHLRVAEEL